MPAQPSTMASARSSLDRGSDLIGDFAERASSLRSSSASTGTSAARTRAQRSARPYFRKLFSIGTMETLKRRDHRKTPRNQACNVEGRFSDADHGRPGDRAGRIETCIVETGYDMGIRAIAVSIANAAEHARHRECLVVIALDRYRSHIRLTRVDDGAGQCDGAGSGGDLRRHRRGRVRIDDVEPHRIRPVPCRHPSLWKPAAW